MKGSIAAYSFDKSVAYAFGISRPKWLKARAYQYPTNK